MGNATGKKKKAGLEHHDKKKEEHKHKHQHIHISGVSLRWFLNHVASETKGVMADESKAANYKVADFLDRVKELTVKESMAEMLQRTEPKAVKDPAEVYIIYSWNYLVKDLIAALESLLKDLPPEKDISIWLDLLCMNQHGLKQREYDHEFLNKTLSAAISSIGRVVAIMSPWDNPYSLTRSWCLWELHCCITLDPKIKLEMIVLPSQRGAFRQALASDVLGFAARVSKIDFANAKATNKVDQDIILSAARQTFGGIEGIQESLVAPIKKWVTGEAVALADELGAKGDESKEFALLSHNVGVLLGQQGLFDAQEKYTRQAIALRKKALGDDHPDVAASLTSLALLLQIKGNYADAEPLFREALAIKKKALGDQHAGVAIDLSNLARLLQDLGQFADAEESMRAALDIDVKALGETNATVALDSAGLASILKDEGKLDEADTLGARALQIGETALPGSNAQMAYLLRVEAEVCFAKNDLDKAESHARKSVDMIRMIYRITPQDRSTAEFVLVLAKILQARSDSTASTFAQESVRMFESSLGPDHPKTQNAKKALADLLDQ